MGEAVFSICCVSKKIFAELEMATIQSFQWSAVMYNVGDQVQIINHSEPACNGQYGTIKDMQVAYDGYTYYYTVELDDSLTTCMCIDDELMEG